MSGKDDDVGLHVLGCRVVIFGTNCNSTDLGRQCCLMSSDVGSTYLGQTVVQARTVNMVLNVHRMARTGILYVGPRCRVSGSVTSLLRPAFLGGSCIVGEETTSVFCLTSTFCRLSLAGAAASIIFVAT